jgi:serralysin
MIQYFDYLSGGYSATGAGYPGAFGFLTPDNADKVYFAPNMSFDFSLIGFRNLTAAQAEAVWTEEYNAIVGKGSTPIIHWPWHDYGPTQWDVGDGPSKYTLGMFTNFIQRAYADGTEFVTGADLAQRIESFVATDIKISEEGGKIIAMVTGSDVGKFALDVETTQQIASVDNWYAFDGTQVFLPKGGGTFAVTLGSQEADVTRIAQLPMRAELLSANGNGTDLDFALNGRGDVKVDLKAWGSNSVIATGADSGTLSGEVLKLSFANLGSHSVNIDYAASATVAGTAGNDVIVGGLGNNQLSGGGGSDTFVYRVGGGIDTVLDFTPTLDKIQLLGTTFADAQAAYNAFVQDAGGATLGFSDTDRLVLANTALNEFGVNDIIFDPLLA